MAVLIAIALSAGAADANHRKKKLARSQCKGFIDCLINTRGKSKSISKKTVAWRDARKYQPGTIVVQTRERALYYVLSAKKAIRYPVGVGRQGYTWSGNARISQKKKWPGWTPP
ncbi:MAG: L,D-transpeptidase, partial [Aestuariivirgaceae bacterium]